MLNQNHSSVASRTSPAFVSTSVPVRPICAAPGCTNVVLDPWDDTGRLCGRCAIEEELFDRDSRRDRVFPA
ncbi:MAG: hypothetical protein ABIT01_09905, partial [Thermoanaerobaculia bacterium]